MNNQKREIIQSQSICLCIICQLNYCHKFFLVIKFSSSLILLNLFFLQCSFQHVALYHFVNYITMSRSSPDCRLRRRNICQADSCT